MAGCRGEGSGCGVVRGGGGCRDRYGGVVYTVGGGVSGGGNQGGGRGAGAGGPAAAERVWGAGGAGGVGAARRAAGPGGAGSARRGVARRWRTGRCSPR